MAFVFWLWLGGIAIAQAQVVRDETKQVEGGSVSVPQVTYTPLRRPGGLEPSKNSPPTQIIQAPPRPPPVKSQVKPQHQENIATISRHRPASRRRMFGFSADVGLPDGANLGLVILPANWIRLSIAGGTNSATFGGRLGLALVPLGWGPSLSFELGRFGVGNTNQLIRSSFEVPSWVDPYVQQVGYSYFNTQLGFDLRLGNIFICIHGGYSNIRAVVRSPSPVETRSSSGAVLYRIRLGEDGRVKVHTWSGKIALIYMFGGV
jgi:hypothetical protein